MALNVKNTISGGNLKTVLPREGLDIGPAPDFWADLGKIKQQFKPRAQDQARALRGGAPPPAWGGSGKPGAGADYDYEPEYATMIGMGPNSGGVAYQSWEPGMTFSPMAPPAQTGQRKVYRPR